MPIDHSTLVRTLMKERAKLFAFVWAIVHDEDVAEDVLQDVMVLALEKSDTIVDESHLLGWSRRAARFKAFKAMAKRSSAPLTLDEQVIDSLEVEWEKLDRVETPWAIQKLRDCLGKLPPQAAKLIRLRYVEGMKSGEIARRLKRELGTIYVSLSRVHRALADCMERSSGQEVENA